MFKDSGVYRLFYCLCPKNMTLNLTTYCHLLADKWKHCVHVFSAEGTYLRQLGKKGHAEGHFQSPEGITSGPGPDGNDDQTFLYVCDTGNDRVQASTAPVTMCWDPPTQLTDLKESTKELVLCIYLQTDHK
jgi:hypothetical protein